MSFNPDDYPGTHSDDWYTHLPGMVVGHVSLVRYLLSPDHPPEFPNWVQPPEYVPRMYFELGEWVGGEWLGHKIGGCGVVLGLDESDPENPRVTLGDYKTFAENVADTGSYISSEEIAIISLKNVADIYAAAAPPDMWDVD